MERKLRACPRRVHRVASRRSKSRSNRLGVMFLTDRKGLGLWVPGYLHAKNEWYISHVSHGEPLHQLTFKLLEHRCVSSKW